MMLLMVAAAGTVMAADVTLDTPAKRSSYAIGVDVATNIKKSDIVVDADAFAAGFKAGLDGKSELSEADLKTEITNMQKILRESMMKKQKEAQKESLKETMETAPKNKEAGKKFLAENKSKEGVVETASGLQYKVIAAGEGAKPASTNTVMVHYTGKLLDGKVFDSSVTRGEPATFPLNRVIAGWTEGVQLMSKGSKFLFWIPSELAYGDRGAGGDIAPGSTLMFEVELLEIVK
jgi:FKBP-type peptidyl-prolyl cis-trans isomerase